jgi:hypothetical protein
MFFVKNNSKKFLSFFFSFLIPQLWMDLISNLTKYYLPISYLLVTYKVA